MRCASASVGAKINIRARHYSCGHTSCSGYPSPYFPQERVRDLLSGHPFPCTVMLSLFGRSFDGGLRPSVSFGDLSTLRKAAKIRPRGGARWCTGLMTVSAKGPGHDSSNAPHPDQATAVPSFQKSRSKRGDMPRNILRGIISMRTFASVHGTNA